MTQLPPAGPSGDAFAILVASDTGYTPELTGTYPDGAGLVVLTFTSATEALRRAVAIRDRVPLARVGVHVGEGSGDEVRSGPAAEVATELCHRAEPGQILASRLAGALASAGGALRLEAHGSLEVAGRRPVEICEVLSGPGGTGLPLPPALDRGPASSFVGRDDELATLLRAWAGVMGGRPRGVLLSGDAGIGKTRLAAELAARVHHNGGYVLHGGCDEDATVAYRPFVEGLRPLVMSRSPEELDAIGGPGPLGHLSPELERRGGHGPDPPGPGRHPNLDPDRERYQSFESVVALLGSLQAPVLLVIDDLQWAARPTLLLVRHLLRTAHLLPLLLVGTYRDREVDRHHALSELMAAVRKDRRLDRLHLAGLDEPAAIRFVEAAAGHELDARSTDFARVLRDHTGGNPFFMQEILNHLTETGTIYQEGGRWTAAPGVRAEDLGLPDSVRAVIGSRLARLSPSTRPLLRMGALVGRVFSLEVLEQIAGEDVGPDAVLRSVDEALEAGVLVEPGPGRLAFAHALFRQELSLELPQRERVEIHRLIGHAMETRPETAADTEALALHFGASADLGGADKAVAYGLAAARSALERFAYEVAAAQAERTLAAVAGSPLADPAQRVELMLLLAEARSLAGATAGVKEAAREAAHEARRNGDARLLARATVLYARWVEFHHPDPVLVALCTEALDALGDDEPALRARVLASLANHRAYAEGQAQDVEHLADKALALARSAGDVDAVAPALYLRAFSTVGTPRAAERLALSSELVDLGRLHRHPRAELDGLLLRAGTHLELGHHEAFLADVEALERLGADQQWWIARYWGQTFRVTEATIRGELERAEHLAAVCRSERGDDPNARIVEICQRFCIRWQRDRLGDLSEPLAGIGSGDSPGTSFFTAALALARLDAGDGPGARRHLAAVTGRGLAAMPRDQRWLGSLIVVAEIALRTDDVALAEEVVDLLLPFEGLVAVTGVHLYLGSVDRQLGRLYQAVGRPADGARHLDRAVALEAALGKGAAPSLTAG